jgi:two-component system OmpR family response regulator
MNILIVEDDTTLADQLARDLTDSGHDCTITHDGEKGLKQALATPFDVLIVDRMLPEKDGLTMVMDLRDAGMTAPVLILSAMGQVDDRVTGLRAGGDDYLTKPYAFSELLARIEVLARRNEPIGPDTSLQVADLVLDRITHTARRGSEEIKLLPREYRLLDFLMQNEGKIVTRTMLLEKVWDLHFDPQTNVIDVHMSRLRAKVDKGFGQPLLQTVRGRGYKIDAVDG